MAQPLPSSATVTATSPAPSMAPCPLATASIASLPFELARDIARLLHPINLAALIRTSRSVRRVFRPADSEIQFAEEHLFTQLPWLRAIVEQDERRRREEDGDSEEASSDEEEEEEYDLFDRYGYGYDDNDDEEEEEDAFDRQKRRAYEKLGRVIPFRQLPLCYAWAVIKMDNFGPDGFSTISAGTFVIKVSRRTSGRPKRPTEYLRVWLERLLLAGIRKLELGFGKRLILWKGDRYISKEASERMLQFAAFVDSAEAARCITETEKTSFQRLPRGMRSLSGHDKENDILPEIKCNQFDLETFFATTSIPRFAYEACTLGAVSVLRFLLDTYPTSFVDLADYRNDDDETYLQRAFKNNRKDVFKLLLDYMKRPPYAGEPIPGEPAPVNGNRELAFLAEATKNHNKAMVQLLLELGADPNFFIEPEPNASLLDDVLQMFTDVVLGQYDHSEKRLERFDLALNVACLCDDVDLIELLIANGADPLARGLEGRTALMACQTAETASALLKAVALHVPHAMQDVVVARCAKKNTALHHAIVWRDYLGNGVPELVRVHLKAIEKCYGDDGGRAMKWAMFATGGSWKETPLNKACRDDVDDDIRTLVFGAMFDGADPATFDDMRQVLMIADKGGCTPVHKAARNGHEPILRKMLDVMAAVDDGMFETVMEMKVGDDGRKPLHMAARNGCVSCVRLLLEYGADPESRDAWNLTPLMTGERYLSSHVTRESLREAIRTASQNGKSGDRLDEQRPEPAPTQRCHRHRHLHLPRAVQYRIHIVWIMDPQDLAALIRASRPSDMELQFAAYHLLARLPWLRDFDELRRRMENGSGSAKDARFYYDNKSDIYHQLRHEVPFNQLPLCYAWAVLYMDNFEYEGFNAISDQLFHRMLLAGIRKLLLGIDFMLISWEGEEYSCKVAYENTLRLAAFLDSVESARLIAEIERANVEPLPPVQDHGQANETRITCNAETFFSTQCISRFAHMACTVNAMSVLRFLLDTYPASFVDLSEYRNHSDETYLQRTFKNNHQDVFKVLLDYMKRPPYGGEPIPGQPAPVNGHSDYPFLAAATSGGELDKVQLLLDLGADPNFFAPEPDAHQS
ncbi:hypothetical protein HDU96_010089 [Phlyctochytrium bullatum]|nr:hypothetical protein HDU96_010089 [Phlyctochytrium bullatum]